MTCGQTHPISQHASETTTTTLRGRFCHCQLCESREGDVPSGELFSSQVVRAWFGMLRYWQRCVLLGDLFSREVVRAWLEDLSRCVPLWLPRSLFQRFGHTVLAMLWCWPRLRVVRLWCQLWCRTLCRGFLLRSWVLGSWCLVVVVVSEMVLLAW